jgi:hypothetical protein
VLVLTAIAIAMGATSMTDTGVLGQLALQARAGIPGVPGSHHPQFIDVTHRDHATVETDGVRTAWARLLGLHDQEGLRDAEPDMLSA